MTAARKDGVGRQHCVSVDFVQRVERIEIGLDTAQYLVAVIDLFDRLLSQRGQPLPTRLAAIQLSLTRCIDSRDASGKFAGQTFSTRVHASADGPAVLDVSHSTAGVVDTATAAEMLGIKEDSVRYLCRRGRFDSVKPGGRWLITAESVERRKRSVAEGKF